MATIAKLISRVTGNDPDRETLKVIMIFCGTGLLVSLVLAIILGIQLTGD
jgi:hypothetical protein